MEWVEQFCTYQQKQKGRTESGVKAYRWNLEQFLRFVRKQEGRLARVADLDSETIQGWMDDMAGADLSLSSMRVRQSALSSLCSWLVKRNILTANPPNNLARWNRSALDTNGSAELAGLTVNDDLGDILTSQESGEAAARIRCGVASARVYSRSGAQTRPRSAAVSGRPNLSFRLRRPTLKHEEPPWVPSSRVLFTGRWQLQLPPAIPVRIAPSILSPLCPESPG
jgi:hypothetical protein